LLLRPLIEVGDDEGHGVIIARGTVADELWVPEVAVIVKL
jgi:hypothetical protein